MEFRLSRPASLFLDFVRMAAAQAVVLGHSLSYFWRDDIASPQNAAVAIFFVLSGIVVPYSTFNKAEKDPRYGFLSYFVDRFSRIYVGLVPGLLFVVAIDFLHRSAFGNAFGYRHSSDLRTFLGNLLMLQDYPFQTAATRILSQWLSMSPTWFPTITSYGSARPLWTVAIEWWIYLLFGWLALGRPIRVQRPVIYWLGLLFFLAVPWFNWVFDGRGNGLTMTWGVGLVILTFLTRVPTAGFIQDAVAVAVFFALAALARVLYHKDAYDPLFVGLFAVALYFALCSLQARADVRVAEPVRRGIEFGANYSYTLYLIHNSILYFLLNWKGTGLANAAMGFVISNLVAIVMYQAFEKHHRALGRRLKNALGIPTGATA